MPTCRLLAYILVVSLALLTAARSHRRRRNVRTYKTVRREWQQPSNSTTTEHDDGQLNFDATLLPSTNTSDWNSNKMIKRNQDFKTLSLSPHGILRDTWVGRVVINNGHPDRMKVMFSTGTSNTMIHDRYLHVGGALPEFSFETPDYDGKVYKVPVDVAGIEVDMKIGSVTKVHGESNNFFGAIAGYVGLGLGPGAYFSERPFYEMAIKENKVTNPVFAFDFDKARPEIHFDGYDKNHIVGLEWHVLVPFLESTSWNIGKGQIDIGNEKGLLQGIDTLFDTTHPGIRAPKEALMKIQEHIPDSLFHDSHTFVVPCDLKVPEFSFRWGAGKPWKLKDSFIREKLAENHKIYEKVSKEKKLCRTILLLGRGEHLVVNPAFIEKLYAIFDMGERQIGLAVRKRQSS